MGERVLLVCGTDPHGVIMGALSYRNLVAEDFDVEVFCKYPETGQPSRFWGKVFLERGFSGIDHLVVVDIPLPQPDQWFPTAAADALERLAELTAQGLKVTLVDHHKASETFYGQARQAGCEVIITSSPVSCHWGPPDAFSTRWGRYGAIADKDTVALPCTPHEETMALGMDVRVKEQQCQVCGTVAPTFPCPKCGGRKMVGRIDLALQAVLQDNEQFFLEAAQLPDLEVEPEVRGRVVVLSQITTGWGFKQLDAACAQTGCAYGVAPDYSRGAAVLAITYWKSQVLPVALALGMTDFIGHGGAIVIPLSKDTTPESLAARRQQTEAEIERIIAALNALVEV